MFSVNIKSFYFACTHLGPPSPLSIVCLCQTVTSSDPLQIHEEQFDFCPHQGKLGQFFIFSRLCESIWSTCVLRTLRRHLTISLWAYCWGSCSGVWSRWLAHCYRPFSPCTTISRAVNRTCLIYWMCFASYQGRPNHASLAIRHNTWFLIQLSVHSLFSKSEIHNSGITDYILLLFLLTANILDC